MSRPDALPALKRLLGELNVDPHHVARGGMRLVELDDGLQALEVDILAYDTDGFPTGLHDTIRYPVGHPTD